MNKGVLGLKTLRDIALEPSHGGTPDMAVFVRELGRVAHQYSAAIQRYTQPMRQRCRGFERWLLADHKDRSVLVILWPANYATSVHDHDGLWGMEMTLYGALEVQSYTRDHDGNLRMEGVEWLGPGDSRWFDAGDNYVHRCRNLSRHDVAMSLHVYGGGLAKYSSFERMEPAGYWKATPQRSVTAGQLSI